MRIERAVIDASVVIKWIVPEHDSEKAEPLLTVDLSAPSFLRVECSNIIWKKVRRGEVHVEDVPDFIGFLRSLPAVVTEDAQLFEEALRHALALDHPVYDCLYLTLAVREDIPLVTADLRFARKARESRAVFTDVLTLDDLA